MQLKRCARDNHASFNPATIESIFNSFYVDDFLKSVQDTEQAKLIVKELILKAGGFHITKFVSNNGDVLKAIPKEDIAKTMNVELGTDPIQEHSNKRDFLLSESFYNPNKKSPLGFGLERVNCVCFFEKLWQTFFCKALNVERY